MNKLQLVSFGRRQAMSYEENFRTRLLVIRAAGSDGFGFPSFRQPTDSHTRIWVRCLKARERAAQNNAAVSFRSQGTSSGIAAVRSCRFMWNFFSTKFKKPTRA